MKAILRIGFLLVFLLSCVGVSFADNCEKDKGKEVVAEKSKAVEVDKGEKAKEETKEDDEEEEEEEYEGC